MSKKKNVEVIDLGLKKKRALVIIILCLVTAIVLTASIIIAVWEAPIPVVKDNEQTEIEVSTDKIPNGNFNYIAESLTSYPKSAQDWLTVIGDQESDQVETKVSNPDSSKKTIYSEFKTVVDHNNTVMGIIDTSTDNWATVSASLTTLGANISANPLSPETDEDCKTYLIYNKVNYASSIYSDSFAIGASSYAKISVKIKLVGVTGEGAFVMVKKYSAAATNSAIDQTGDSSATQQWLAYDFGITQAEFDAMQKDENGYATLEYYLFNLSAVSSALHVQIGLGDVYTFNGLEHGSTGCLLIDDVQYTEGTANDYVESMSDVATCETKPSHTFASTSTDDYIDRDPDLSNSFINTVSYADYKTDANFEAEGTLPFAGTGTIYYIERLTSADTNAVYLSFEIDDILAPSFNTCYHYTFWMRTLSTSAKSVANVYLVDGEGTQYSLYSKITTSEDVTTDRNNGWTQYHVYIKPGNTTVYNPEIRIYLGDNADYVQGSGTAPTGKILVTNLKYEQITQSEYAGVSTSSSVNVKLDLETAATATSITNGSFNSYVSNSTLEQLIPSDWTFAFAGQINITGNGQNEITVPNGINDVTSGIVTGAQAPANDDETQNALFITNNVATSAGYLSGKVSIAAHSYAVFSIYAKGEAGATPYVYLINTKSHEVYEGVTTIPTNIFCEPFLENFDQPDNNNGYVRYYFFVVTGDTSETFRLALFNGGLAEDGTAGTLQAGTVYFDYARVLTYGTYERTYEYNEDNTDYIYDENDNVVYSDEDADDLTFQIGLVEGTDNYGIRIDNDDDFAQYDNVKVVNLKHVLDAPEIEVEEEEDEEEDTTAPKTTVDVALILSIVASCLLVFALLLVVILKTFNIKKRIE